MPPLSDEQLAAIEKVAAKEGVDPKKLADAAERIQDGEAAGPSSSAGGKPPTAKPVAPDPQTPKLYMYLLPFVTVAEVRSKFLGLTAPFAGDKEVAADWAAEHGGTSAPAEGDQGTT